MPRLIRSSPPSELPAYWHINGELNAIFLSQNQTEKNSQGLSHARFKPYCDATAFMHPYRGNSDMNEYDVNAFYRREDLEPINQNTLLYVLQWWGLRFNEQKATWVYADEYADTRGKAIPDILLRGVDPSLYRHLRRRPALTCYEFHQTFKKNTRREGIDELRFDVDEIDLDIDEIDLDIDELDPDRDLIKTGYEPLIRRPRPIRNPRASRQSQDEAQDNSSPIEPLSDYEPNTQNLKWMVCYPPRELAFFVENPQRSWCGTPALMRLQKIQSRQEPYVNLTLKLNRIWGSLKEKADPQAIYLWLWSLYLDWNACPTLPRSVHDYFYLLLFNHKEPHESALASQVVCQHLALLPDSLSTLSVDPMVYRFIRRSKASLSQTEAGRQVLNLLKRPAVELLTQSSPLMNKDTIRAIDHAFEDMAYQWTNFLQKAKDYLTQPDTRFVTKRLLHEMLQTVWMTEGHTTTPLDTMTLLTMVEALPTSRAELVNRYFTLCLWESLDSKLYASEPIGIHPSLKFEARLDQLLPFYARRHAQDERISSPLPSPYPLAMDFDDAFRLRHEMIEALRPLNHNPKAMYERGLQLATHHPHEAPLVDYLACVGLEFVDGIMQQEIYIVDLGYLGLTPLNAPFLQAALKTPDMLQQLRLLAQYYETGLRAILSQFEWTSEAPVTLEEAANAIKNGYPTLRRKFYDYVNLIEPLNPDVEKGLHILFSTPRDVGPLKGLQKRRHAPILAHELASAIIAMKDMLDKAEEARSSERFLMTPIDQLSPWEQERRLAIEKKAMTV